MYKKARVILNEFDKGFIQKLMITKTNVDLIYANLIIKTSIKKYIESSHTYFELLNEIVQASTRLENVRKKCKEQKENNTLTHLSYTDFEAQRKNDLPYKEDVQSLMKKIQNVFYILCELNERKKIIKELHFFLYIFLFKFCCDKQLFSDYLYNGGNQFKPFDSDEENDLCSRSGKTKGFSLVRLFHKESVISELYSERTINKIVLRCIDNGAYSQYKNGKELSKEIRFYNILTAILYYAELDNCLRRVIYEKMKSFVLFKSKHVKLDVTLLQTNAYISKMKKLVNLLDNINI